MRKLLFAGLIVLVLAAAISVWLFAPWPAKPVEDRISSDASFDFRKYDGSMPPGSGSPEVLVLGSTHLAQGDHGFSDEAVEAVVEALTEFAPDMVAVEYLPPQYPEGKGRDYRPDLSVDERAAEWNLDRSAARNLIEEHARSDDGFVGPCRIGQAHLVNRDLMNALYYWLRHDCPELEQHQDIARWAARYGRGETVRFGFQVAENRDLDAIVSIDYQGEDARWFIYEPSNELIDERRFITYIREFWPMMSVVGTLPRASRRHYDRYEDDLIGHLHHMNSPEHIGYQYWVYEEVFPTMEYKNAGARQTENYWLRNKRMFEYLGEAMEREQPERILITVGSGHKYFLDELVREAGYRWIDPREVLPPVGNDDLK